MRNYYLFSAGNLIRKDNTLAFETEDGRKMIPVEDIDQMYCFGEMNLNSALLNFLAQKGITAHFFNYYGHYSGSFIPREAQLSGFLMVKQVEHYLDTDKRLVLAKAFVETAIHNIRRNLEKREFSEICNKLDVYRTEGNKATGIEELMSVEAHARKLYYSVWEEITDWEFGQRSKQPPQNALNALISFGNMMTYTLVLNEIHKTALNPTISYLHEPSERRYSLSLDVAEIFKPVFIDRLIFRLINLKMLTISHFDSNLEYTYLNEAGRKIFVREFDQFVDTTIMHRNLKRKVRYKNMVRLDLYKLVKHLIDGEAFTPMKVWW
ncbi:CRISPR-associated endonuclease Cas1 [Sporomusa ovata DSM 2662]|uniref:CRISPR-associated endonuclease Cas1 n=1 Tax=Sporomusa ovata TaxID=2378 RepID=A0A0U1KVR0_9FIRM|nr:type I-B CRISPR-associated endonuclease Cas1b [Sporomusa ovata]EQB26671.1 CRISPR-associated endonuclease Cas1 [Sporomusa ovata DSM 2662]CQR70764.1 CRISPR-associated protein Cas1 [Sporomusa ovata]